MKNIDRTMDEVKMSSNIVPVNKSLSNNKTNGNKMDDKVCDKDGNERNVSIMERIVHKTGNRKLAAILALDLFLVGVDTVMETNLNLILCFSFNFHLLIYLPTFMIPRC